MKEFVSGVIKRVFASENSWGKNVMIVSLYFRFRKRNGYQEFNFS